MLSVSICEGICRAIVYGRKRIINASCWIIAAVRMPSIARRGNPSANIHINFLRNIIVYIWLIIKVKFNFANENCHSKLIRTQPRNTKQNEVYNLVFWHKVKYITGGCNDKSSSRKKYGE